MANRAVSGYNVGVCIAPGGDFGVGEEDPVVVVVVPDELGLRFLLCFYLAVVVDAAVAVVAVFFVRAWIVVGTDQS